MVWHRLVAFMLILPVFGQIDFSAVSSVQLGNLPNTTPKFEDSYYQNISLRMREDNLKFFLRVEGYFVDKNRKYLHLPQGSLSYSFDNFKVTGGHFYEQLGQGLLLRAYELPGTIFESQVERVRYGFYKDILGATGTYQNEYLTIKGIYGKVLSNQLPPTFDSNIRRVDEIMAGEFKVRLSASELGAAYMQHDNFRQSNYLSLFTGVYEWDAFDLYGEYAYNTDRPNETGFYGSFNFYHDLFNVVTEYKKYQRFAIGSGVNDPPPLIRETTYALLARKVHPLLLNDEEGYAVQLETALSDMQQVSIAYTESIETDNRQNKYQQLLLESFGDINADISYTLFFAAGKDGYRDEMDIYTVGILPGIIFSPDMELKLDFQYQQYDRRIIDVLQVNNILASASGIFWSELQGGITLELSNDPQYSSFRRQQTKRWLGIFIQYQPNYRHELRFFGGERRGGPACQAGVCYEVLDFNGFELNYKFQI
jgi:hypothetical protein